ncbi:hypothetical protein ES705_14178 [subsurface metagenome]
MMEEWNNEVYFILENNNKLKLKNNSFTCKSRDIFQDFLNNPSPDQRPIFANYLNNLIYLFLS